MLEKLSAVMDTKVGQMKCELEEVANKAHDSQMTELKRMKFSGRLLSRRKATKFNRSITSELNFASLKQRTLEKLSEGKEQIETRQKLILLADKSEYGWKTVLEYLDNELAEDDAKKIKKAEKEAQRKLNETRNAKKTRANNRGGFSWSQQVLSMADEHGCLRIRCHINNQHHRLFRTPTSTAAGSQGRKTKQQII